MDMQNSYTVIDLETWKRRKHFELFSALDYPFIGAAVPLDVTVLLRECKTRGYKFFTAFLYVLTHASGAIENFRYRIDNGKPVLFDRIDSAFTVFDAKDELFYFAIVECQDDFAAFSRDVDAMTQKALAQKNLSNVGMDVLYSSCTPWFAFTDVIQPMGIGVNDAIPRFLWGKYQQEGERVMMPFSITAHHGLVDGVHMGKLFEGMQKMLDAPDFL